MRSKVTKGLLLVGLLAQLGCRVGSEASREPVIPLFQEAAERTGLIFHHFSGATGQYFLPEIMGSGVALLDFDLDGDLDVYLLQGIALDGSDSATESRSERSTRPGNRLFENRIVPDGQLAFVDVTEGSGLGIEAMSMGVAVGDYDADRDPDLYLTNVGPNHLLRNNGDGSFDAVPGPQDARWSTSATFFDYDSDGDLDLFFTNFVDFAVSNNKECFSEAGERDYCVPTVYKPVPDRLFRNEGETFSDVTVAAGLATAFGNGLGSAAADLNGDGRPDLYVANDSTENQLWFNRGDARFENRAMTSGAAVNGDGRVEAGMGIVVADFDGDRDQDLFMTHNAQETNTLYLNEGNGTFLDATNRFGLGSPSLPLTGFGVVWADFDHDGLLDVFVANGAVAVMEALRGMLFPYLQENQFYRGSGDGFELSAASDVWGELAPLASRGVAAGDLDLDHDLDLVVTNNNGPARLYLNQSQPGRRLTVRLEGQGGNRHGIGAQVGLCLEDGTCTWRRLHRDGSYLSSGEAALHFGLPAGRSAEYLEVRWPAGGRERYPPPQIGSTVRLQEGSGRPVNQ